MSHYWAIPILVSLLTSLEAANRIPVSFETTPLTGDRLCQFVSHLPGSEVCIGGNQIVFRQTHGQTAGLRFIGASRTAAWEASDPAGSTIYRGGPYESRGIAAARHYRRLWAKEIYPRIDALIYGADGRLEYDFVAHPGADPRNIRLAAEGGDFALGSDGGLLLRTAFGELLQPVPAAYQRTASGEIEAVHVEYRVEYRPSNSGVAAFALGDFDPARELVIDPVIDTAGLFGGSGVDRVVGGASNTALVGATTSADFPGVVAARHQNQDVFVYSPDTDSTIIIGGSGDDIVTCVASFPAGGTFALLIGGYTDSRDLTLAGSAFQRVAQTTYGGGAHDGFYITLYGSSPQISYYGGSGDDRVLAITASGAIAGSTDSPDLPLRRPWQSTLGGGVDGFVATFRSALAGLDGGLSFSTYLGGSGDERVLALASRLDASGTFLYMAGESRSNDWKLPGEWSGQRLGVSDAFVIAGKVPQSNFGAPQSAGGVWLGGSANSN